MTVYDHHAIRRAYPERVLTIHDGGGIFDGEGNPVTDLEQSKIDAARNELDKEVYRFNRVMGETPDPESVRYPDIGDQLDDLFHKGAFSAEMSAKIQAVKDQYPKPS